MSQTTSCLTCGAELAPDQRYCLACGTRVAAPRLDFAAEAERARAEAGGGGAAQGEAAEPASVVAAAPAPEPSRLDKVGGPMGIAAIVLVALGIGFLGGRAVEGAPSEQKAPVVNIEGGTAPEEAAPPADAAPPPAAEQPQPTTNG